MCLIKMSGLMYIAFMLGILFALIVEFYHSISVPKLQIELK